MIVCLVGDDKVPLIWSPCEPPEVAGEWTVAMLQRGVRSLKCVLLRIVLGVLVGQIGLVSASSRAVEFDLVRLRIFLVGE
jgi:hypothetical protein